MGTNYVAHLRDTRNGKTGKTYGYLPGELGNLYYMWEDGNYSCDCNRGPFLYDDPDYDMPCNPNGKNVIVLDELEIKEAP